MRGRVAEEGNDHICTSWMPCGEQGGEGADLRQEDLLRDFFIVLLRQVVMWIRLKVKMERSGWIERYLGDKTDRP